jgi:hypothetical protein
MVGFGQKKIFLKKVCYLIREEQEKCFEMRVWIGRFGQS